MSKFSEYVKDQQAKDEQRFFGETKHSSNKYFTFSHVIDEDTIILNTANVREVKGNPVLVIANNQAVYLKDFNLRKAHNYGDVCENFYCVKISRQYFKPYTFRSDFDGVSFDAPETFDSLMAVAETQDSMPIALGWMN